MSLMLLVVALVIIACIIFNKFTSRFGMPALLAFIVLGMIFGSDGLFKIPFDNYAFAETICSAALILIMFYGGFGTNWNQARPAAVPAVVLSTLGVILTSLLTGAFCYYALHFPLWEGMLVGALLGSTDAASVFSILRSKRLNLKYNTASLLEIESGSNDPFAYMLTIIVMTFLQSGNASPGEIILLIGKQLLFGVIFGVIIGLFASRFMSRFHFTTSGFDSAFVLAVAVLSYAAPSALSGNGYLSAYLAGLILGNNPLPNKRSMVHFIDGITGLMQMLIFFLLGLLSTPSTLPDVIPTAFLIFLFLTFAARPTAVSFLLMPFQRPMSQQLLTSWAGLRGAASIVFAIMVSISETPLNNDLFHIVFTVVLLSISLQGSLLPTVAKKLDMIDDEENVMRTFNDYADETAINFIRITITSGHSWAWMPLSHLALSSDLLVVMILRGDETLTPHGSTVLQPGDVVVLCAATFDDDSHIRLSESTIDDHHPWCNHLIRDLTLNHGELIVMIRRGSDTVIPNGNTQILSGDVLVINRDDTLRAI
ncbi:MAG: potassium/proton antiporter [Firmicutes bacterium]|nr:potassium/proton antiporter [Bacillota bacterium]